MLKFESFNRIKARIKKEQWRMQNSDTVKPTEHVHYYDNTVYWNNFPATKDYNNLMISGKSDLNWIGHIREKYGSFDSGFFLNCGNGWVERDFFQSGVIRKAVGVDILDDLLRQAREGAASIGMPAEYRVADCNRLEIVQEEDCVVNHAALHHVANIDHVCRELCRGCRSDGFLFSYDYVGPHRNQYPWEMWSAAVELWDALPREFRTELQYPHLPTMLHVDPTEAVHSDLIIPTLARYFDVIEEVALGGALAYLLLFQNHGLYEAAINGKDDGYVARILDADREFTAGRLDRTLFAFSVYRPRKMALDDVSQLDIWTREEKTREADAHAHFGRYGSKKALEIIYEQMDEYRRAAKSR